MKSALPTVLALGAVLLAPAAPGADCPKATAVEELSRNPYHKPVSPVDPKAPFGADAQKLLKEMR